MKKNCTKIVNLVLAIAIIITTCSIIPVTTSAANYSCTMTLEELQTLFPHGRYWNHVGLKNWDITTTTSTPCTSTHRHGNCKYGGGCGCNSFKGKAIQCMGFAYTLQNLCFDGFDGYDAPENWNYSNAMAKLKPGDVIRLYVGSTKHSIFVTSVKGDTITYMDCNGTGGGCIIRHNQTITKSALKSKFVYVSHAPVELVSNAAHRVNLYETALVTSKSTLTIRERPDITSKKIGYLRSGESINVTHYPVTDSSGYSWRMLMDGTGGWVCSSYLKITGGQVYVSGIYKIQCANGKYLSYTDTPANDVNVVAYDDLSITNLEKLQLWNFTPLGYFLDSGAFVYRISPVLNSNYSLDCDPNNNELLHLWKNYDTGAQQWIVEIRSDGSMRILNNATRFALDVKNSSNKNNAEIISYTSHNGSCQRFYLVEP